MIEIPGNLILLICLLRCLQYLIQSPLKQARAFWLAGVLIFMAAIRRELSYLSDVWVPNNFALLSHSYDWWEDMVLTLVFVLMVGLLTYAWRYLWAILKKVPLYLYCSIAALAVMQYMGEHAIGFPEAFGVIVEELSETSIYAIALIYLWRLNPSDYAKPSKDASELPYQTTSSRTVSH